MLPMHPFPPERSRLVLAMERPQASSSTPEGAPEPSGDPRALQRAVVSATAHLVGAMELDAAIDATLAEIGHLAGAGRAYLFCFHERGATMSNTHEWCAEGVTPQKDQLQDLPSDMFPWWMAKLRAAEVIHVPDVAAMPPEASAEREILEAQDIKSLLVLPVYGEGELIGFLGFDDVEQAKTWGPDDFTLLQVVAEVLAGAIRRNRAEQAQRSLEQELTAARRLEAIGRLAGGVAHEFNNLLAVIMTYTEVAQSELEPGCPAHADLAEALDAAGRARDLVRSLLEFSRSGEARPRRVDVNGVLAAREALLRSTLGERVELRIRCAPDVPPVMIDPGRLEHAIMHLVLNSQHAMPDGGRLEIETTFVPEPEPTVRVRFTDSGVGMTPDVAERVFEPFFTTKAPTEGHGLGLSSVYGLVTRAGGDIRVETAPGVGTTFTIDLPAAVDPPPGTKGIGEDRAVLLVEDEAALRSVMRRLLQRLGFRVLEAETPAAALALAEREGDSLDLVLTDVIMPEMNGPELASRLTAIVPGLRVLFMSGYAGDTLRRCGLDETHPVLAKPFSREQLVVALERILARPPSVPAE